MEGGGNRTKNVEERRERVDRRNERRKEEKRRWVKERGKKGGGTDQSYHCLVPLQISPW